MIVYKLKKKVLAGRRKKKLQNKCFCSILNIRRKRFFIIMRIRRIKRIELKRIEFLERWGKLFIERH